MEGHSSGIHNATTARYKVIARGVTVGDVTTTQHISDNNGLPGLSFETRTSVNASFLWLGYHQDTVEKGVIRNGVLVSYSRKGTDNGSAVDVTGKLGYDSFRFDIHEKGRHLSQEIPKSSYDYTTMECPEARIAFNGEGRATLRILDVEKMAVVRREYHLVRTDQYTVAGKEYPCRVVDFTDPNKKARRWIRWDGSTVILYRQDGSGERNAYSVQATSISRES